MFSEVVQHGNHLVRTTYNLIEVCSKAKGIRPILSGRNGPPHIYECFSGTVKNAEDVLNENYARTAKLCLLQPPKSLADTLANLAAPTVESVKTATETVSNLASQAAEPAKSAEIVSHSFLESLTPPGLVIAGVVVVGVVIAGCTYYNYAYKQASESKPCESKPTKPKAEILKPSASQIAFNSNILKLNNISSALKKYALGCVEKEALDKIIDETRSLLKEIYSEKKLGVEAIKKQMQEIAIKLNKISFEGKGIKKEDTTEVGYIKRTLISAVQTLKSIFFFIGQYISKEYNPTAKALLNCSFFISVPTTQREEKEIKANKEKLLDVIKETAPDTVIFDSMTSTAAAA